MAHRGQVVPEDARQEASKVGEEKTGHRGQSGSRKMGPARGKQGGVKEEERRKGDSQNKGAQNIITE